MTFMGITPNDFKQLPQNGFRFETLICQLLEAMGYRILERPAIGTEGGRDILVERVLKDFMSEHREKVVVQCKHYAHSGRTVGDSDIGVFQHTLARYQAQGYLLVCSTKVTENLSRAFRNFTDDRVNSPNWAKFWDLDQIIAYLNEYPKVRDDFFPQVRKESKPADILADEIQVWLDTIGYDVIRKHNVGFVDLEARLQRGLDEQHVLVRCIPGEITVKSLEMLNNDIAREHITKGWAVSDRNIPSSARAFTEKTHVVRPFSLADFVSQIFGSYFQQLRSLVEGGDILKYYVNLACYRRNVDKDGNELTPDYYAEIDQYVDDWLKARDTNHLSILGEIGSGKTWFCRHYAYRQLERYMKDPVRERLPILITLRDFVKQVDVGSLIRKLFDEQEVRVGGNMEAFEKLNRQGKLLLIFDGFDEMAVKVDYQTVVDFFYELTKVVVPGSKALLTCRTGYFRYATEAEKVMGGEVLGRQMIVIRPPKFEVIYLEPFNAEQIREVVTRRRGSEAANTILTTPDLMELARQPVLIEMLLAALPDIQAGEPLNRSDVYWLAVSRWLDRDIITERTFLNSRDKLFFMTELAWHMFSTGELKIHYKELPMHINRHFNLDEQDEQDHYDYDIRTKSFLRRDSSGYYEFSHKSIMEYLVAYKLVSELGQPISFLNNDSHNQIQQRSTIQKPPIETTFGLRKLTVEVRDFLADMIVDIQFLWELIEKTKGKSFEDVGFTGGNAATLLRYKGASFANKNLVGSVLVGADLSRANLTGVQMQSALLRHVDMSGCLLVDANLSNTDIRDILIDEMGSVCAISWNIDRKWLAIATDDAKIRVWDSRNWREVTTINELEFSIQSMAWVCDGKILVIGDRIGRVMVIETESWKTVSTVRVSYNPVVSISISHDVIDLKPNLGVQNNFINMYSTIKYLPDNTVISFAKNACSVIITSDGSLGLISSNQLLIGNCNILSYGSPGYVSSLHVDLGNKRVVTYKESFRVDILMDTEIGDEDELDDDLYWGWDFEDKDEGEDEVEIDYYYKQYREEFEEEYKDELSQGISGRSLFELKKKFFGRFDPPEYDDEVMQEEQIEKAYYVGFVEGWDSVTGERILHKWNCDYHGRCFTPISPTLFAIGSVSGYITIWDSNLDSKVITLMGHSGSITNLIVNDKSKLLASGSVDGTVRIWNIDLSSSDFGHCVKQLEIKMDCRGMRIGGGKGLNAPGPQGEYSLRHWFIKRGAQEQRGK